jgi:[ribosomal protein S5]-alanine N-acetyltransferase
MIIETDRLRLSEVDAATDGPFILELLNTPGFIDNIGDRGVRDTYAAENYIRTRFAPSYVQNGFGLWRVDVKETNQAAGICGLLKRDTLEDIDIGYAFLPQFTGRGLALESAAAVMDFAREKLGVERVVAITVPHNKSSIRLLEKLGFVFEKMISVNVQEPDICLYACVLSR